MASPQNRKQEVLELLSAACDGRLDEAASARLEHLLGQDDESCALLVAYSQLHADLQFLVAANMAERRALARLPIGAGSREPTRHPAIPAAGCPVGSAVSRAADGGLTRRRRQLLWLVAVAAGLMLPLAVLLYRYAPPTEPPAVAGDLIAGPIRLVRLPDQVAYVTSSADAQWTAGQAFAVGQYLSQGDRLELTTGAAQISMASGVDVVLQAPSTLVLLSEKLVRLEKGKLSAHAAKWASGFVVETRGLRVTDLGTKFAVSADSSDASEAHVLEGAVLAEPLGLRPQARSRVRLQSGQAIRVDLGRERVDRLAAQRDRFVEKSGDFRPFRPIAMHNTGAGLSVGDVDPHWTITAGEESVGPWPQSAVVGRSHYRYSDNAPGRSQWISVAEGTTKGVPPETLYTFETSFDLTGFDLATVNVVAQIVVDNGVQQIRLNGRVLDAPSWVDNVPGQEFQSFRAVEIREGFAPGTNRLEIDVYNGIFAQERIRDRPNPMALRVEWQAFGREAVSDSLMRREI